jgi:hypothetical protein
MDAKIDANNEKFQVLRGTLISWTDVHNVKTEANRKELMAAMKVSRERIEDLMDVSL